MTIEKQILAQCLNTEFYKKASDVVDKEMFANGVGTVFDTIAFAHDKYGKDLTTEMLLQLHRDRFPSMPDSSRESIELVIKELTHYVQDSPEIMQDLIANFWRRDRAQRISSKATDIWLGNEGDYEGLRVLLDELIDKQPEDSSNYVRVEDSVSDFLNSWNEGFEFKFELSSLQDRVGGVGRGNLGVIFARPETGKTTFCSYLVAEYIRQGFKVAYFANEEPGKLVKGRVFCAYLNKNISELQENIKVANEVYENEIKNNLFMLEGRGISVREVDKFIEINKPDIVFIDQLDKVNIKGVYSRIDEKLRAVYESARAIAKRNSCMVWAVSQASYEAHNRQEIDFSMLENSRTGKAAEADVIIGIGKNFGGEEDYVRHLCVSKNKLSGWHGTITCRIDIQKARYLP